MFWKKDDRPTAHILNNMKAPALFQKNFNKYGVVLEDDGETIWLYATDAKFTNIFCAVYIAESGYLCGKNTYLVHNVAMKKVGLFYDEFKAVIDFKSKKACVRSAIGAGSNIWGKMTFNWESSFENGLEP